MNKTPRSSLYISLLIAVVVAVVWKIGGSTEADGGEGLTRAVSPIEVVGERLEDAETDLDDAQRVSVEPKRAGATRSVTEVEPPPLQLPEQGLYGRVKRPDGTPVAHCDVWIDLPTGQRHTAITDLQGNYALSLDLSILVRTPRSSDAEMLRSLGYVDVEQTKGDLRRLLQERRAEERLRGRAVAKPLMVKARDRYGCEVERSLPPTRESVARVRLDLVIAKEARLGGSVLGMRGPIPEADVLLFGRDWELLSSTRSDETGEFQLSLPDAGPYHIHARKLDAGSAASGGIHLGIGLAAIRHELALGGDGTLRGQLLLPNGEPIPGVEIIGVASALAILSAPHPTWPAASALAQFEEGRGLAWSRATTDDAGRFWMEAVQEGDFMLFFEGLPDDFQPPGLYRTGVDHRVAFNARILSVQLKGTLGVVLRTRVHIVDRTYPPQSPTRKPRHAVLAGSRNGLEFVVEPGTVWGVFWELDGVMGPEERVRMRDDRPREIVFLEIDEDAQPRSVRASILPQVEGAAKVDFFLNSPEGPRLEARVTLWRREGTGRRRLFSDLSNRDGVALPELEPGAYDFSVEAAGEQGDWSLPIVNDKPLELVAGQLRQIELDLLPAGRLRVALASAPDLDPVPASCRVQLVPSKPGGSALSLAFPRGEGSGFVVPRLAVGSTASCDALIPPGKYELRVDDDEGLRGVATVEIIAGQEITVEVEVGDVR